MASQYDAFLAKYKVPGVKVAAWRDPYQRYQTPAPSGKASYPMPNTRPYMPQYRFVTPSLPIPQTTDDEASNVDEADNNAKQVKFDLDPVDIDMSTKVDFMVAPAADETVVEPAQAEIAPSAAEPGQEAATPAAEPLAEVLPESTKDAVPESAGPPENDIPTAEGHVDAVVDNAAEEPMPAASPGTIEPKGEIIAKALEPEAITADHDHAEIEHVSADDPLAGLDLQAALSAEDGNTTDAVEIVPAELETIPADPEPAAEEVPPALDSAEEIEPSDNADTIVTEQVVPPPDQQEVEDTSTDPPMAGDSVEPSSADASAAEPEPPALDSAKSQPAASEQAAESAQISVDAAALNTLHSVDLPDVVASSPITDTGSITGSIDSDDKHVSFAPGTPEPKPTKRKKKSKEVKKGKRRSSITDAEGISADLAISNANQDVIPVPPPAPEVPGPLPVVVESIEALDTSAVEAVPTSPTEAKPAKDNKKSSSKSKSSKSAGILGAGLFLSRPSKLKPKSSKDKSKDGKSKATPAADGPKVPEEAPPVGVVPTETAPAGLGIDLAVEKPADVTGVAVEDATTSVEDGQLTTDASPDQHESVAQIDGEGEKVQDQAAVIDAAPNAEEATTGPSNIETATLEQSGEIVNDDSIAVGETSGEGKGEHDEVIEGIQDESKEAEQAAVVEVVDAAIATGHEDVVAEKIEKIESAVVEADVHPQGDTAASQSIDETVEVSDAASEIEKDSPAPAEELSLALSVNDLQDEQTTAEEPSTGSSANLVQGSDGEVVVDDIAAISDPAYQDDSAEAISPVDSGAVIHDGETEMDVAAEPETILKQDEDLEPDVVVSDHADVVVTNDKTDDSSIPQPMDDTHVVNANEDDIGNADEALAENAANVITNPDDQPPDDTNTSAIADQPDKDVLTTEQESSADDMNNAVSVAVDAADDAPADSVPAEAVLDDAIQEPEVDVQLDKCGGEHSIIEDSQDDSPPNADAGAEDAVVTQDKQESVAAVPSLEAEHNALDTRKEPEAVQGDEDIKEKAVSAGLVTEIVVEAAEQPKALPLTEEVVIEGDGMEAAPNEKPVEPETLGLEASRTDHEPLKLQTKLDDSFGGDLPEDSKGNEAESVNPAVSPEQDVKADILPAIVTDLPQEKTLPKEVKAQLDDDRPAASVHRRSHSPPVSPTLSKSGRRRRTHDRHERSDRSKVLDPPIVVRTSGQGKSSKDEERRRRRSSVVQDEDARRRRQETRQIDKKSRPKDEASNDDEVRRLRREARRAARKVAEAEEAARLAREAHEAAEARRREVGREKRPSTRDSASQRSDGMLDQFKKSFGGTSSSKSPLLARNDFDDRGVRSKGTSSRHSREGRPDDKVRRKESERYDERTKERSDRRDVKVAASDTSSRRHRRDADGDTTKEAGGTRSHRDDKERRTRRPSDRHERPRTEEKRQSFLGSIFGR